ncbi:SIS domain-containing protein [Branchiibius sp. NY16-3462-2]|uniref:SIS domain-containing protein n=1 Tax=Branchiibius sp. NY16-3462-2 TaxID=1807500 RepID=UPI00079911CC|nr:SIS domain-containing protein [Branchiibius sp. NY16-3462-2]KYH42959.1 phosphosugar isomerase [Branchiibius sp. NY16-3462-2]
MPRLEEAWIDDPEQVAARDSRGTLRALATAGAQVRESMALAHEAGIDQVAYGERPRSVLVSALGGSAVVADILQALAEQGSPVPVTVRRNVPVPAWVGPLDLVVAVSLSGAADGPVAVAAEAARRGAALLTVGAQDSVLADISRQARGVHVDVGRGRTSSRTSLWSLLTPVLMAGDRLGLVDVPDEALAAAAERLNEWAEACRPSSESFVNPAKSMALSIAESVPVVLGDGPLTGVAALRAVSMLSRTARIPATWGELPDTASQVVSLFDGPFTAGGGAGVAPVKDIFADPFLDGPEQPALGVVMLRDAEPGETADALTDSLLETARDAGATVVEHRPAPGPPIARLAEHVALTDFAATYVALGLGVDPAVSPHLADYLERVRAKGL